MKRILGPLTILTCCLLLCSCAVTTRAVEGTTETFENTSDASTELSSSTSPRSEEHHHHEQSDPEAAVRFIEKNKTQVKENAASGNGEYLDMVAALLAVPKERRAQFGVRVQEHYHELFASESSEPTRVVAKLDELITAKPTLR